MAARVFVGEMVLPPAGNPVVREADGPRDACHLLERQREDGAGAHI